MVSTFDQDTALCLSLTALYEELSDSVVISLFPFFSCPADSSIGDLVTHALTH